MWYDSPFRDPRNLTALLRVIRQEAVQPIRIMEVCGGQTYALSRYRIEELLPDTVRMIHGPGCPVCVTPAETVAQALAIARMPDTILCTFGDMMRVPDTEGISLQHLRTEGHDIRIVYSPLDALKIARENRHRQVVFLAVGFETTTPLYTLLLSETIADRRDNLSLLTSLFTLPAAIEQLARDPECRIDALLAAGHVCSITGLEEYRQLARQTGRPIVVTGFEPADLLYGIYRALDRPGMSLILTVLSLGTRVLLAYLLSAIPAFGVTGIWWSVPIGWFLADLTGFLYYRAHRQQLMPWPEVTGKNR